jgi:hypothetical protein
MNENVLIALLVNIPAILAAVVAAILALKSQKSASEARGHAEVASLMADRVDRVVGQGK